MSAYRKEGMIHAHMHTRVHTQAETKRDVRETDTETDRNEKWDYVIKLQSLLPSHVPPPPRLYLRTSYCSPTVWPAGDQVFKHKNLLAAAHVGGAHFIFEP